MKIDARALALFTMVALACTRRETRNAAPAPDVAQPPASTTSRPEVAMPKPPPFLDCPAALVATRRGGTDADRYAVPTDAERDTFRELVARIVRSGAAGRDGAATLAASVGFEIVDVPELHGVVLVREVPTKRRGGGAYLVRLDSSSTLFVQAPHTFFDEGTLPLACELFARGDAHALYIDTAHRYKAAEADEKGSHPADVAHAPASLFQAATEGALRASPRVTVVQVHGFAVRDADTQVVVSSGERVPGNALVARVAQALSRTTTGVLRFPEDTTELGATTNVQGSAVRKAGGQFVHVEIQSGLRRTLLSDAELRGRFLGALAGAVGE